ncbi:MAG: ATP-dependent metallopeptidase FtsH/Yme1/Tma family protein [Aquificaceae bacterium]
MKSLFIWVVLLGFMVLAFNLFESNKSGSSVKTPVNTLLELAEEGKLKEVKVKDNILTGMTTEGQKIETGIPPGSDVVNRLLDKGVKVEVAVQEGGWLVPFLVSWLPIILFIGIWIYMMRQMSGGGNPTSRAFSFGKSRAKVYIDEKPKVTLGNVAGMEEVKEEVKEIRVS